MKRWISLLLSLMLLGANAMAEDSTLVKDAIDYAKGNLTEVYGYRAVDADHFEFKAEDMGDYILITYYPKERPDWVYSFRAADGQFSDMFTPFGGTDYQHYPGQNSVLETLYIARDEGWFAHWDQAAMNRMTETMATLEVTPTAELASGLADGAITAPRAIQAYFESCYGPEIRWTLATGQLRDEVLSRWGLEPEKEADKQGIQTYTLLDGTTGVTQFAGEAPQELRAAFAHPKLKNWTLLCGAVISRASGIGMQTGLTGIGYAAFEKKGQRLLATAFQKRGEDWQVLPVGEKALLTEGQLSISCDSAFFLEYSLGEEEKKIFTITPTYNEKSGVVLSQLQEYRYENQQTGSWITINDRMQTENGLGQWYHVVSCASGQPPQEADFPVNAPQYLEMIDITVFPKTAEACAQAETYTLPENCGLTVGVHLRKETSSRSRDLGDYNPGTIVEVLETVPGNPSPWAHVRIGSVEGYMSAVYVDYVGSVCTMNAFKYGALPVAKTKKALSLKKGIGWLDGTVQELAVGTKMHVLAQHDQWLHVMLPSSGEPGWMMDSDGIDGYVKAADVIQAGASLQLDWME